jgi:hypothetical protein
MVPTICIQYRSFPLPLTVHLLPGDALDVDDPLLPVDGDDLALAALQYTSSMFTSMPPKRQDYNACAPQHRCLQSCLAVADHGLTL